MPRKKSDIGEGAAVPPRTEDAGKESPPEAVSPGEGADSTPASAAAEPAAEPVEPAAAGPVGPAAEPLEPLPGPEPATEEPLDEHHEEEAGPSLAGRLLTYLLILIAGIALGIWGAPKVAPRLPSGLKPVADWLAPGQRDAEAAIATLEERLNTGLGNLESRLGEVPAASDLDQRIASAVGDAEGRLGAEIAALKETVAQPANTEEVEQRLARLESALDGQSAELAAIKDQLAGAADASGQVSQEALQKIDVYRAELEGLRAEMGTLQDKVGGFAARLDQLTSEAEQRVAAAQSKVEEIQQQAETRLGAAEIAANLALIRGAIAGGQPYEQPLSQLAEQPRVAVQPGLEAGAASGVATLASLRDSYPDAAHAAIRASIVASAGEGVLARTRAFLKAQVASRSLTPQQGAGTDAVLSRMEDRLRNDDLDGALAEAEQLPSEAAAAMSAWLDAARKRAEAVHGLAQLESDLSATN